MLRRSLIRLVVKRTPPWYNKIMEVPHMKQFIPYEKLAKKAKRELNKTGRVRWAINPVTRKPPNPKAYNRKKSRQGDDDFLTGIFY